MSERLSDEWIREQIELCGAATPGPWKAYSRDCSGKIDSAYWTGLGWQINKLGFPNRGQFERGEDALFVAAAREGYPLVLKEVMRLKRLIYHAHSQLMEGESGHAVRILDDDREPGSESYYG